MKILIIDDCEADRKLIIEYLKRDKDNNKYNSDESDCLLEGISKIQENEYDAIILDLHLPETDGLSTIEAIQRKLIEAKKNIPIVILTTLEDYRIGTEALSLGVKDFLFKGKVGSNDIKRSLNFATF